MNCNWTKFKFNNQLIWFQINFWMSKNKMRKQRLLNNIENEINNNLIPSSSASFADSSWPAGKRRSSDRPDSSSGNGAIGCGELTEPVLEEAVLKMKIKNEKIFHTVLKRLQKCFERFLLTWIKWIGLVKVMLQPFLDFKNSFTNIRQGSDVVQVGFQTS